MFSWLLLSPSRLPEMQGGDKKKGGRKRQNAGAQVEHKEFMYFISLPHRGDYFIEPAWGGDPWAQGRTGRLSLCHPPCGGQVLGPALSCRYSLEAPGFLLLSAIKQVSLMESKARMWWASRPRGVPGSLMQSQHRSDGERALLGKLSKKAKYNAPVPPVTIGNVLTWLYWV